VTKEFEDLMANISVWEKSWTKRREQGKCRNKAKVGREYWRQFYPEKSVSWRGALPWSSRQQPSM